MKELLCMQSVLLWEEIYIPKKCHSTQNCTINIIKLMGKNGAKDNGLQNVTSDMYE